MQLSFEEQQELTQAEHHPGERLYRVTAGLFPRDGRQYTAGDFVWFPANQMPPSTFEPLDGKPRPPRVDRTAIMAAALAGGPPAPVAVPMLYLPLNGTVVALEVESLSDQQLRQISAALFGGVFEPAPEPDQPEPDQAEPIVEPEPEPETDQPAVPKPAARGRARAADSPLV